MASSAEEDAKGEDGLLSPAKAKALATKNGKADNFTVEIPEKTAVRIIFRGADKKTSVTVKVTS